MESDFFRELSAPGSALALYAHVYLLGLLLEFDDTFCSGFMLLAVG